MVAEQCLGRAVAFWRRRSPSICTWGFVAEMLVGQPHLVSSQAGSQRCRLFVDESSSGSADTDTGMLHTLIWTVTHHCSYIVLLASAPDSLRALSLILPCSAPCLRLADQRLAHRPLHSDCEIVSGELVWLHLVMHQGVIYHQDWYVDFWHCTGPDTRRITHHIVCMRRSTEDVQIPVEVVSTPSCSCPQRIGNSFVLSSSSVGSPSTLGISGHSGRDVHCPYRPVRPRYQ